MRRMLLYALFASVAIFYLVTIRQGNHWGDDFALYIHHAENIAMGRPYGETGLIYNPGVEYSPRIYPPVFPLLLAPLYRLFGLNFFPMKLEEAAFFVLALAAVCVYWRRALEFPYLLSLILVLGFNPVFWDAKDDVLSDLPFLFFFYAVALLAQFAPRQGKAGWKWALLTGVALYLCMGTRGIGVTLLAGLVLYDVLARRRITTFTAIAVTAAGALALLQRALIGPGLGSYADYFHPTVAQFAHNLLLYARCLGTFWLAPAHRTFSTLVYGLLCILALSGIWAHAKHGLTIVEAFLAPYMLLLMVWPVEKGIARYLFPLLPFFVYMALSGVQRLTAHWRRSYALAALSGLVLLVGFSYLVTYRQTDFGPIAESDGSASFAALCRTVRTDTSPRDVFIYRRARALSLFTERPAAAYQTGDDGALWAYMRSVHAAYLITGEQFVNDREFLIPFVEKYAASLQLVYHNSDFGLYRIRDYPEDAGKTQSREARLGP
jgi:hypothetical protein